MSGINLSGKWCAALAAALLCADTVRADYWVSWRIDESNGNAFDYAKVAVNAGDGYSAYLHGTGSDVTEFDAASLGATAYLPGDDNGATVVGSGTPQDAYLYRVELWSFGTDADDALVAVSDALNWGQITAGNYGAVGVNATSGHKVWVAENFHTVPEPTSGLLFLLGLASLALRRRRV